MNHLEKLKILVQNSDGLILTKDIEAFDIPRHYISVLVKKGYLKRVSRGVYITPNVFDDVMFRVQQKNKRIIYSHETALYLHGLTDRDPVNYNVTVPHGYNGSHLKEEGIIVYTVKKELYELGTFKAKTIFGREITIYDKERTMCDLIRNRNNIDIGLLNESFRRYIDLDDKNIPLLLKYAEKLNVLNITRNYLEILL